MSSRKKRDRHGSVPRSDVYFDEQVENRFFSGPGTSRRERKTAQLCAQVLRTLSSAFGELADPVLRELSIDPVVPAPDASRLLARVYFQKPPRDVDVANVLAQLHAVRGFLRAEIATVINRKRTPELDFELVCAEVNS